MSLISHFKKLSPFGESTQSKSGGSRFPISSTTGPQIKFFGSQIEKKIKGLIRNKIEKLTEQAPSDSFCKSTFKKIGSQYVGHVEFTAKEGRFGAESHGKDLTQVLGTIISSIEGQLDRWKATRFEGAEEATDASSTLARPKPTTDYFQNLLHSPLQKRVLIVDDQPDSVKLLQNALKALDCKVRVASDGYEAINELSQSVFDILFLDWMMPGIDGGTTLEQAEKAIALDPVASENWGLKPLPVVVYSSMNIRDMNFPSNELFKIVGLWDKSTTYQNILWQTGHLFQQLESGTGTSGKTEGPLKGVPLDS